MQNARTTTATTKERGRPPEITDGMLISRRNSMLGTFEYHWAEIGWELQRAKSADSIRRALRPIPDPRRSEFDLFLYEPTQKTTLKELREHRRTKDGLLIELRKALPEERKAQESLEKVEGAMKDSSSDANTEVFLHRYQRRYSVAKKRVEDLKARIDSAESELRKQGAYIAQSGLLDFIGSKRYELSPLSYANAMAGLSFVTWRQSASRCVGTEASHAYLSIYELFQEVQRALVGPPQTATIAAEQMKAHLKKSKRQNQYVIQTLKGEWYYLRVAIETAYSQKPLKNAIPYRVFAEYQRRSSSRSRWDQVMAEEESL